jgi:GAF domain-containing protein
MIASDLLSNAFVAMADRLVDDFDLVDFLHDLTSQAAAISGADAVGLVLADGRGRVRYMASSNESGEFMELIQLQNHEGPCLDCVRTGAPVINVDLADVGVPWPIFAPRAVQAGFKSVHAFPLRLRKEVIGALNLFSSSSDQFADDEIRCVQALADVATIAVLQERAVAQAGAVAEQLQAALNDRIIIEQAKGALAQTEDITPNQAFERLRDTARSSHRKLVDTASELLRSLEQDRGSK